MQNILMAFLVIEILNGKEIYRIASGINPGLLESNTQNSYSFAGFRFKSGNDPSKAFEIMLDSASSIAEKLHASICDSSRAPLSKQMIEHLNLQLKRLDM